MVLLHTGFNVGRDQVPRIVDGDGVHFVLADGRRVIDASDTGCPLGHRHPDMVQAIKRAADLPVVNEGWLWVGREQAADDLIETAFHDESEWVGGVRFCLSGSEANDLALSLCQVLTGRTPLATRERAYHGLTGLARDVTVQPQWHGGIASQGTTRATPRTVPVRQLPGPGGARIGKSAPQPTYGGAWDSKVRGLLADAAGVIIDYTQGGTYYSAEYQNSVASAAKMANTLWIADEVVTGLGRFGRWFGFQGADSRPDIVTMGKPLAGGASPAGAVVVSKRIMDELLKGSWQTYSTFRGHPLTMAAVRTNLNVLQRDDLIHRANEFDGVMYEALKDMAARHPSVKRVDGRGLHWTVELHGPDWRTWHADTTDAPLASRVTGKALEAGALIGTSAEQTSLFIAPPLIIQESDLRKILDALDHGLNLADAEFDRH